MHKFFFFQNTYRFATSIGFKKKIDFNFYDKYIMLNKESEYRYAIILDMSNTTRVAILLLGKYNAHFKTVII